MKGSKNIFNLFRSAIYRVKHKNYSFPHYGLNLFIGHFGSGKTLSCVDLVTDIVDKFPKCSIISNVDFYCYKEKNNYFFVNGESAFISKMVEIFSGDTSEGSIVLIDEVQSFLIDTLAEPSSVNYKVFFAILSQLRKCHCLMIFTSQLYSKVPKVLREYIMQNGQIVTCKRLLPGFTYYGYYDMNEITEDSKNHLNGKIRRYDYSIHTPELYEAYDSFAIVSSISEVFNKGGQNGHTSSSK